MFYLYFQSYIHGSSQAQFVAETHIVIVLSILFLLKTKFSLSWQGENWLNMTPAFQLLQVLYSNYNQVLSSEQSFTVEFVKLV